MKNQMLRMGFVGVGDMTQTHMKMYVETGRAKVVCICGRNADRMKALSEDFGCSYVTDYMELLARPDIDAVSIGTPNPMHYDMALEALKAGKHIAVQYPITQTTAQFDELLKEAEKNKLIIHHSLTPIIEPPPFGMEKLLDKIGKVMMLRSVYIGGCAGSWYLNEHARGNFYSAFTIHQIVYENRLMKEYPDWVFGALNFSTDKKLQIASKIEQSDKIRHSGSYMSHYPSGAISYNEWGMGYDNSTWTWTIEGEKGRLVFEKGSNDLPDTITVFINGSSYIVEQPSRMDSHREEVNNFIAQILDGKESYVSIKDTRKTLSICEAAIKSAQNGEKVTI